MDLIYMNAERVELGILQHYTLDLDIADSKDFEIKTLDDNVILKSGYWFYIDGTEYGGRIDKVEHDTKAKTVIYTGRNWRGLLNSKIIEPAASSAYAYAEGSISNSMQVLLEACDYDDLFTVDTEATTGTTPLYQFARYCTLYDGIISLLESANSKLQLRYNAVQGKCVLSAGLIVDHSDYLAVISQGSLNFKVSQKLTGVNHLVCLGRGDGENRAVIHLFLDKNGALQQYKRLEEPLQNSHYILDKSKQAITGVDERAEVYDYSNAEITYNYVVLSSIPDDWQKNYKNYYIIDADTEGEGLSSSRYKNVEPDIVENYTLLSSQPADWATNYSGYYKTDGAGGYEKAAEYAGDPIYTRLYSQPDDWATNYGDYYYYHNDGVTKEYRSVGAATNQRYVLQTAKPSDWSANFKNYYCIYVEKPKETVTYVKVTGNTAPKWKASTYYRKNGASYELTTKQPSNWTTKYKDYYTKSVTTSGIAVTANQKPTYTAVSATASGKAPTWAKNKYYTKYSDSVAPTFRVVINGGEYYASKEVPVNMPTWAANTYYKYEKTEVAPDFKTGKYYKLLEDWYKVLVAGGIEKLAELNKAEKQSVTLGGMEADIGDIVSGYDLITEIDITEPVTNIIVKIKNDVIALDYTVGGH